MFGASSELASVMEFGFYLASSFTRLSVADMPHRHRLRSASTDQIDVPFFRRSTIGGRAFAAAGAKVWNGLNLAPTIISIIVKNVLI